MLKMEMEYLQQRTEHRTYKQVILDTVKSQTQLQRKKS